MLDLSVETAKLYLPKLLSANPASWLLLLLHSETFNDSVSMSWWSCWAFSVVKAELPPSEFSNLPVSLMQIIIIQNTTKQMKLIPLRPRPTQRHLVDVR